AKVTGRQSLHSKAGSRVKREWVLSEQDELYLLGSAQLRHPDDRALSVGHDEVAEAFMISVEPEYQVMLGHARVGFFMLNVALLGGTVAVLSMLTMRGFSPFDFFLAALFPLLYLGLLVLLFLYNDLVSLRERVKRAVAMIDVALKK